MTDGHSWVELPTMHLTVLTSSRCSSAHGAHQLMVLISSHAAHGAHQLTCSSRCSSAHGAHQLTCSLRCSSAHGAHQLTVLTSSRCSSAHGALQLTCVISVRFRTELYTLILPTSKHPSFEPSRVLILGRH